MKRCKTCLIEKTAGDFNSHSGSRDGLHPHCRPCQKQYQREYRQKNAERLRQSQKQWRDANVEWRKDYQLKLQYGVSLEQYEEMHSSQDGKCMICGEACPSGRRLAVDHDHSTGAVRGLLCSNCNTGLGKFQDRPELLRLAAAYLERD